MQSKVTDIVLGKDKPIEEFDPDYEKLKHYIIELEDHLGEAQKQSFRLAKRHKGWLWNKAYFEFSSLYFSQPYVSINFWGLVMLQI